MKKGKVVIGRRDVVDFEKLELLEIDAKIDSGAYTSSLHCTMIEKCTIDNKECIKCNFLDPEHVQYHEKEFIFDTFGLRKVKSSNGQVEERFSIVTEITIFNQKFPIELTLTERQDMKYPVLLGRKFLSKKFIINTAYKNLSKKGILKKIEI